MGSDVNKTTNGGQEDLVFQSKDITSKTKAGQEKEYFVKFKEKTAGQKFSEWFHKHKKKITIIMCIVVGLAVAAAATIVLIKYLNRPTPEQTKEEELNQIIDEAQNLLDTQQYTVATDNIEQHVEEAEAEEDKAEIYTRFALTTFKTYAGGNSLGEVLDYLYKAEDINPTADTAMNIAIIEEIEGETSYVEIYRDEAYRRDPNYDIEENEFYIARKEVLQW
ncbi:hypothetical protein IJI94_01125 [Candidatus Saccharibacteria bacterium]|nr:hypothetical protein [Candidatus Saccharibacteria bacterium]